MIDEKALRPCKANELFPGAIFYLKMEDSTFARCVIEMDGYSVPQKEQYRKMTSDFSKTGCLFVRRDKPFHDFSIIRNIAAEEWLERNKKPV